MRVPFSQPWITKQDTMTVSKALTQKWLTNGPNLKKFESKIQKFIKCKYAVGVGSATQALHLSLRAIGIQPNDEVIVPSFTFVATANAVLYCGAKPIFADADLDSFNISIKDIKNKISKKTKAIIPVHYGGQSCDMNEIQTLAKKHNLFVVEDCAHALGTTYHKKKCGNIGDLGCFSFYPTKIITTGEGGMITTNNSSFSKTVNLLRSHGLTTSSKQREFSTKWQYDVADLGYNYRLDEIRSSLGLSQFSRIEKINKSRINIAKQYDKMLKKIKGIKIPSTKAHRNHIYHLYTIKIEKEYHLTRDQVFHKLSKKGIGTSIQYFPIHSLSYFRKNILKKKVTLKNSELLQEQVLSLPIFPQMTSKQIDFVVSNLS